MLIRKFETPNGIIIAEISTPIEEYDDRWTCRLNIHLTTKEIIGMNAYGLDALDSILYALRLLQIRLSNMIEEGGDVKWIHSDGLGLEALKHE